MPIAELSLADFPEGSLRRVEQGDLSLVVIRANGQIRVYRDECPHAFWPLSQGSLKGNVLECPGHGWEFDVVSGQCLNTPDYCLSAITASIEGNQLILQWNDAGRQDRASSHCGNRVGPRQSSGC